MNGDEQQAAGTRYAQLSAVVRDLAELVAALDSQVATLLDVMEGQQRTLAMLKARLDEEERGTLVDLRGNRFRTSTRN